MYTADTLTRAPLYIAELTSVDSQIEDEADLLMEVTLNSLPVGQQRLQQYLEAQQKDPICRKVVSYCHDGWPDIWEIEPIVKPYWLARDRLTVGKGLLLYGERIIVPNALQKETLHKLHEGHQGLERSRLRAKISVFSHHLTDYYTELPNLRQTPNQWN
jgi:hypothetical protein